MPHPHSRFLRLPLYLWSLPTTALGLLAVLPALCTGGKVALVDGVLEVHGGIVAWALRHCTPLPGGATALTLGHVVLGLDAAALDLTRSHERIHVRQCERWGPFFIPAYLLASLIAALRGKHFYRDNAFERQAYRDK